jgi:EmrB/QacA subfamily drug resistance transporter
VIAEQPALATAPARSTLILATMLTSVGLVFATTLSVSGALPEIGASLRASQTDLHLVADVYPVMVGSLVLPFGALLDRFGRRRGMCVGLVVLTAGMVWSGLCGNATELIVSRLLSGAGGAIVLPGTLATITHVSSPEKRSRNIGLWAGATMVGGTLGFVIGGAVLELASWNATFIFFAGVAAVCLLATAWLVPETRQPGSTHVDPVGSALSFVAIAAIVFAVIELPDRGIGDPLIPGCLILGAIMLAAFIVWELRNPRPLIDLRLFRNRSFSCGVMTVTLTFAAGIGYTFLSFQFLSYSLGYSALGSGLALIPCAVTVAPAAALGPRLAARVGRRPVMAGALAASAVGCGAMALAATSREYWPNAIAFFLYGIGLGLGQAPPTEAITEALPRSQQGLASAINDTSRELGGALGIAILGSAFNAAYRSRIDHLLAHRPLEALARSSPAVGLQAAAHHADTVAAHAVRLAAASGMRAAFALAAALCVVFAAIVYRWCPPGITPTAAAR